MASTVSGVLLTGNHAARPSSGVTAGTLYACSTHSLIYQTSDTGSTWATWADLTAAGTNPQFTTIELGHASDTTLARVSAGVVSIEGTNIVKAGAITGSGLTQATSRLLGRSTASSGAIEEITLGTNLSFSGTTLNAAGGGGSGSIIDSDRVKITSGNKTLSSGSWANLDTGMDLTLTAASGDICEVSLSGMYQDEAQFAFIDCMTLVSGAGVSWFGSGEPTTTTGNGVAGWHHSNHGAYQPIGCTVQLALGAGDITGGTVVLRLRYRNGGGNVTLRAETATPLQFSAKIWRP